MTTSMQFFSNIIVIGFIFISVLSNAEANQKPHISSIYGFGEQISDYLAEGNTDEIDKLIDKKRYVKRVARVIYGKDLSKKQSLGFVNGFSQNLKSGDLAKQLFGAIFLEEYRVFYVGLNKANKPVIRIDYTAGGHDYMELFVKKNGIHGYLIEDFRFASRGQISSVTTGNAIKYMLQPRDSILKRLLGGAAASEKLINDFKNVYEFHKAGDYVNGYKFVEQLPDELRNRPEINHMAISFAERISDELYQTELARFAKYHGHQPSNAFMLIDHYFYQQEWDNAISAINSAKSVWGDDGVMNALMANVLWSSGQINQAITSVTHGIEVEPNFEDGYWTGLDLYVETGDFTNAVAMIDELKHRFDYIFTDAPIVDTDGYIALSQSDTYINWLNNNR